MILRVLFALCIGIGLTLVLFPDIRKWIYTLVTNESFTVPDGRKLLEVVGKEPIPKYPVYTNDPRMGNARRDTSKLPSIYGNGFSLPASYNKYEVPDYKDGFIIPQMNAPRASEMHHSPRSDAFHMYYQSLYDTLDTTA